MKGRDLVDRLPAKQRRWVSPVLFGLHHHVEFAIRNHARGRLLDVGCGAMPFREVASSYVSCYDGLDIEDRTGDLSFVGDAQDMSGIAPASYETVLFSEVIEHLPEPTKALNEIERVLTQRGVLILTAPHLSRLHEIPNDYSRWTSWGLVHLLQSTGFEVISVRPTGNIWTFLFHQIAMGWLGSVGRFPRLFAMTWWVPAAFLVFPARALDLIPFMGRFPVGHVVVGRKRSID